MTTGLKANADGSAAVQVGGSDYINIASSGNVTIPQDLAVTGDLTVSGTLTYPNVPNVLKVYPSTTQTVPTSWTKMPLDTVSFDTSGDSWNAANTRFNPQQAGYYQVYCQAGIAATGTGYLAGQIGIYKNGTLNARGITMINGNGLVSDDYGTLMVSNIVYMNGSTDYIEVYWYKVIGTSTSSYVAAADTTYMTTQYIRS